MIFLLGVKLNKVKTTSTNKKDKIKIMLNQMISIMRRNIPWKEIG
jgi:hypothetical protein